MRLVVTLGVLHVTAIGVYSLLHVGLRSERVRFIYGGVWTALTLLIALRLLARIREIRVRARRQAAARRDGTA